MATYARRLPSGDSATDSCSNLEKVWSAGSAICDRVTAAVAGTGAGYSIHVASEAIVATATAHGAVWRAADPGGAGAAGASGSNAPFRASRTSAMECTRFLRSFSRQRFKGQEQAIALPPDRYLDPRLSPDGTRVAVAIERSSATDIWVLELQGGHRTRLTEPPGVNRYPLWTLDGSQVLFASSRDGEHVVYQKPASGLGRAQPLISDTRRSSWPWSWAPEGRAVALSDFSLVGDTGYDISVLSLEGERVRTPLLAETSAESQPSISPNGRWIAYRSNDSGRVEIYVRPFSDVASSKTHVSTESGTAARSFPVWSRDGRELFYQNGDAYTVVSVDDGLCLHSAHRRWCYAASTLAA